MKQGLHILIGWLKILYQDSANTRYINIFLKMFYCFVLASCTFVYCSCLHENKKFPNSCRALLSLLSSFPLSLLNKLLSWITSNTPLPFSPNLAIFPSPAFFLVLFFILSADSICLWRWGVQSHLRTRSAPHSCIQGWVFAFFFSFFSLKKNIHLRELEISLSR